jgi:hypothetical protein
VLQQAAGKVAQEAEPTAEKISAVLEDKAHVLRVTVEDEGDQIGEALKEQVTQHLSGNKVDQVEGTNISGGDFPCIFVVVLLLGCTRRLPIQVYTLAQALYRYPGSGSIHVGTYPQVPGSTMYLQLL